MKITPKVSFILETGFDTDSVMFADGLEDALVGIGQQCGKEPVAIYDMERVFDILITRDGMTREEAVEFFEFNIAGAYVGEQTPIFMSLNPRMEWKGA